MAQAKIPAMACAPVRAQTAANDVFKPVPAKPRRYSRGVLWADRAGVPEPDYGHLSLMRSMERKNKG